MYTEHEPSGGGDGKPEYMKIKYGIAMMPLLKFEGGCQSCRENAQLVMNTLLIAAMVQTAKTFKRVMQESRGECDIEIVSDTAMEHLMREKLGNEVTDKFMEIANGGI